MAKVILEKLDTVGVTLAEAFKDHIKEFSEDVQHALMYTKEEIALLRKIKEFVEAKVKQTAELDEEIKSVEFVGPELDTLVDLLTAYEAL